VNIVIIGGGPGGYEAALVAADAGADVTVIEAASGLGGACVLWDCVPSKTLCTSAESVSWLEAAPKLGASGERPLEVDWPRVVARVLWLAEAQSRDVEKKVSQAGVRVVHAQGRFVDPHTVEASSNGDAERFTADIVVIATGSSPRELPTARPDGSRVLNARQVYDLGEIPHHLVVVGSGATGAEFAHAFNRLGARVTLVCSRDRVLPGEDPDAAAVIEKVFAERGMEMLKRSRAVAARATADGAEVELTDGRVVAGSHALMTVGQVPNSTDLELEAAGVSVAEGGAIPVDGVSRTSVSHIYAAGDVTGPRAMLASVAAMQGRIAMWHALGRAVTPMRWDAVAATVFTDPEVATVGLSQAAAEERGLPVEVLMQPLATNARAKMDAYEDGFIKLIAQPGAGTILGASVVSPHASDLILPLSVAVHSRLSADQLAYAFSIYPSLGGSIQEAARRLMGH
jgi:NAD(P)H dehydrogenase (quinone)